MVFLSFKCHTISPRHNAFLHIPYRSADVSQSSSPKPIKDRVPVVRHLATHSPDRLLFFPCRRCRRETIAGRPKPRRDDGKRPLDDSAHQQNRRSMLLLVAKEKNQFVVRCLRTLPCHKPELL